MAQHEGLAVLVSIAAMVAMILSLSTAGAKRARAKAHHVPILLLFLRECTTRNIHFHDEQLSSLKEPNSS